MAHKKAKTTGTGADGGKSRYMTRAEAKDGARVHRRREDGAEASGYRDCACRDCFEIAIGVVGAMCSDCEDAGCADAIGGECQAPGAYGVNEEE